MCEIKYPFTTLKEANKVYSNNINSFKKEATESWNYIESLFEKHTKTKKWLTGTAIAVGVSAVFVPFFLLLFHTAATMWYAMDGDRLIKAPVPEGASSPGAHLDFTGIRFPLSYGFNVSPNNTLELTAGINYWVQAKAENLLNGKNYEGFLLNNYRPLTVDFRLSWLSYSSVGLYVKYMPPLWFKPSQGPQNHTVSLGGIIRL